MHGNRFVEYGARRGFEAREGIDFDRVRAENPLTEVIGAVTSLRRVGANLTGCCPLHDDRSPSLTIYADERFHCFGCGAHGDVVDFVMVLHGTDYPDALSRLNAGNIERQPVRAGRPSEVSSDDRRLEAAAIWNGAGPIEGTPAEMYLRRRGISVDLPRCLRFASLAWGRAVHPTLVAQVTAPDGQAVGVHRIFLKPDGGKADLPNGKVKFSLGPVSGGAIRLAPAQDGMVVCAGIEDGLSLMQLLGRPVWAVTGDTVLPKLVVPNGIKSVIVAHDADEGGVGAGKAASETLALSGRTVRSLAPAPGCKDFNEELMEALA